MDNGWVKAYRKKWEHPAFRNLLEAGIWAWMCETSFWEQRQIRFNGALITLERGQLATSIRFISTGFNISEQVTRTFLKTLKKQRMITLQPTHWGTIITICNYDKFQDFGITGNTPANLPETQTKHTPSTNNKELKEFKDLKEEREDELNRSGPRRAKPFKIWLAELQKDDPEIDGEHCPDFLYEQAERMGQGDIAIDEWFKFHDHWLSVAGSKNDWAATWRNWLRRAVQYGKR